MTDIAAILGISALCMVLVAVITSSDFPLPSRPSGPLRNLSGAIELPPFGPRWRGLYPGRGVPEQVRQAPPPAPAERPMARVHLAQVGPYR